MAAEEIVNGNLMSVGQESVAAVAALAMVSGQLLRPCKHKSRLNASESHSSPRYRCHPQPDS